LQYNQLPSRNCTTASCDWSKLGCEIRSTSCWLQAIQYNGPSPGPPHFVKEYYSMNAIIFLPQY